jgi:hypothetical protein
MPEAWALLISRLHGAATAPVNISDRCYHDRSRRQLG